MTDEGITPTPTPEGQTVAEPQIPSETEKQLADVKVQLEEAKRKITEETTSRATLAQRISELEESGYRAQNQPPPVQNQNFRSPELESAVQLAQENPAQAMEQLGRLINKAASETEAKALQTARQEISSALSWNTFLNDQKKRVADEGLGEFENQIAAVAKSKMDNRVPREKAVTDAITEFKAIKEKMTPMKPPEEPKLPPGARAEGGSNPPPTPPPPQEKEITVSDEIKRRQDKLMQKRYGIKSFGK